MAIAAWTLAKRLFVQFNYKPASICTGCKLDDTRELQQPVGLPLHLALSLHQAPLEPRRSIRRRSMCHRSSHYADSRHMGRDEIQDRILQRLQ
jgi:hypothetical protein